MKRIFLALLIGSTAATALAYKPIPNPPPCSYLRPCKQDPLPPTPCKFAPQRCAPAPQPCALTPTRCNPPK